MGDKGRRARRCETCRFYEYELSFLGQCRRHAPEPIEIVHRQDAWVSWPLIRSDEWCGEWEAKA